MRIATSNTEPLLRVGVCQEKHTAETIYLYTVIDFSSFQRVTFPNGVDNANLRSKNCIDLRNLKISQMPKWQALLLDKLLTVRVFAAHGRKKEATRTIKGCQTMPDFWLHSLASKCPKDA